MIDLKALRAAAEAATPGKWKATRTPGGNTVWSRATYIALANPAAIIELVDAYERLAEATRQFIDGYNEQAPYEHISETFYEAARAALTHGGEA